MQNKRSRTFVFLCLLVGGAILCFCFRMETVDSPQGIFKFWYRWNVRHTLYFDPDRDGEYEFKAILDTDGTSPLEFWEDRDENGHYEIHVKMAGSDISLIEIDRNADGHPEVALDGVKAALFWKEQMGPPPTF